MWTVIRISSSRRGLAHRLAAAVIPPLLLDRLSSGRWPAAALETECLAVEGRDVADRLGDLSYHFLGFGGLLGDGARELGSEWSPPV